MSLDSLPFTPDPLKDIAVDIVDGKQVQVMKPAFGDNGAATMISLANPQPAADPGGASSLLRRILDAITSPRGFDPSLSRQRVTATVETLPTLANVTTVATVTTVAAVTNAANLTNLDGRPASMLVAHQNLSAWAACVRSRIT
jgi:hypothetical protein